MTETRRKDSPASRGLRPHRRSQSRCRLDEQSERQPRFEGIATSWNSVLSPKFTFRRKDSPASRGLRLCFLFACNSELEYRRKDSPASRGLRQSSFEDSNLIGNRVGKTAPLRGDCDSKSKNLWTTESIGSERQPRFEGIATLLYPTLRRYSNVCRKDSPASRGLRHGLFRP